MDLNKKTARIAGLLFLVATGAAIVSGVFLGGILDSPDYLTQISANEAQVVTGAVFYFIMAAAGPCIAISMYPILRKHNKALAIGSVGFRLIEGTIFMIGVINILSLVTLSQQFLLAGSPSDSYFQTLGFLLQKAGAITVGITAYPIGHFAFGFGALMYYYIFYQSKLVPQWLSVWGLIAIVSMIGSILLDMYGVFPTIALMLNMLIFAQEMVLAVWLIVKGFNSSATAPESA
jgi:hypothetical protein